MEKKKVVFIVFLLVIILAVLTFAFFQPLSNIIGSITGNAVKITYTCVDNDAPMKGYEYSDVFSKGTTIEWTSDNNPAKMVIRNDSCDSNNPGKVTEYSCKNNRIASNSKPCLSADLSQPKNPLYFTYCVGDSGACRTLTGIFNDLDQGCYNSLNGYYFYLMADVNDLSARNNNAWVPKGVKVDYESIPSGKALKLNGDINSYVEINPNALNNLSNFTVSLWIKTQDKGATILSASNSLFGDEFRISNPENLSVYIKGAKIYFGNYLTDNAWHQIVVTIDLNESTMLLYLDGNVYYPVSIENFSNDTSPLNVKNITLGQDRDNDRKLKKSDSYSGLISELAIFNKILEPDKVYDYFFYRMCVSDSEKNATLNTQCSDSDNGYNPYVPGKASGLINGRVANGFSDFCLSDPARQQSQSIFDGTKKQINDYYDRKTNEWYKYVHDNYMSPESSWKVYGRQKYDAERYSRINSLTKQFNDYNSYLSKQLPYLSEFYCSDEHNLKLSFFNCEQGCNGGKCLGNKKQLNPVSIVCNSTDEGNPFVQENTTVLVNGNAVPVKDYCTYQDYFVNDKGKKVKKTLGMLNEFYCDNETLAYRIYTCDKGCNKTIGVCVL